MYRSLLFVLMGLLVCGSAVAAEEMSAVEMGEVVVTATREPEMLEKVPANVTVVTTEQIEQSAADSLPELLRSVPGVLVNDIAGNKRNYTVDLRGFGETASLNTLVLIDGRRVNQADLSGVDWTLIPLDRVARVEIVHGGRGSVLYGDNAAGGVINIITRKGIDDTAVNVELSGGSYDAYNGNVSVQGSRDTLSYAANASYTDANGYRDNSETEMKDFGLSLGYSPSDRVSFSFNGGFHDDETGLPGALTKSELATVSRRDSLHPDDYADVKDWYIQGETKVYITDDSSLEMSLSRRTRESQFFSFFSVGEYEGNTEIDTIAFSPQLVINQSLGKHDATFLVGFDYEDSVEDIVNTSIFFGIPSTAAYELSRTSRGIYAHADFSITEELTLSGGYRKDDADYEFVAITAGTTDTAEMDEDLYTLGLNYHLDKLSLYASYSKSYRYPVLDEMFNFFFNTIDSTLGPQVSDDFEAGLRYKAESGLQVGINLFRVETEDEIIYNPIAFANQNLDGDSIRQGVELSLQQELFDILFRGSYTYRDTEIDGGQFDGNELPNVPEHQAKLSAQTNLCRNVRLGLEGSYVGERRFISDFGNTTSDQDDYLLLNGKLSYLLEAGTAYLVVNNILDEEYSEYGALNFLGEQGFYPSPGITLTAGVNFNF